MHAIAVAFFAAWRFLPSFAQTFDPVVDFCRRFGHQTAVIDDRLYVVGGYVDYGGSVTTTSTNYTNTFLLWSDLTTVNNVQFPPMYSNLSKPSFVPSVIGGALWADTVNKFFYLWGGEYNWTTAPPTIPRLWYYDAINDVWNVTANAVSAIQPASFGASTVDQVKGVAYYYGGWSTNATILGFPGNATAQQGLVTYDMTRDLWNNITFIDGVSRAEGLLLYLPVSDSGMLAYLGGVQQSDNGTFIGSPMDQIYLFEIASQRFYMQPTSGTAPPMRRRFCGGVSWPSDRSSYNIYLYGGNVPPNSRGLGFNDVWILSIPSFEWTNYYNGSGFEHHSSSCNVINEGQMIVMGGAFPNSSNTACDSQLTFGQHNLDLGSVNVDQAPWYQFLPNISTYDVPPEVVALIGGSSLGGATVTAPSTGFANTDLAVYMTRKAPFTGRTATRDVSSPTGTQGTLPTRNSSVGPIVGGVVGGVIALILVTLICYLCLRRRQNPRAAASARQQQDLRGADPISELAGDGARVEAPGYVPAELKGGDRSAMTTPTLSMSAPSYGLRTASGSPEQTIPHWHQQSPSPHDSSFSRPSPEYYPPPPLPQQYDERTSPTYELSALRESNRPHMALPQLDTNLKPQITHGRHGS